MITYLKFPTESQLNNGTCLLVFSYDPMYDHITETECHKKSIKADLNVLHYNR